MVVVSSSPQPDEHETGTQEHGKKENQPAHWGPTSL